MLLWHMIIADYQAGCTVHKWYLNFDLINKMVLKWVHQRWGKMIFVQGWRDGVDSATAEPLLQPSSCGIIEKIHSWRWDICIPFHIKVRWLKIVPKSFPKSSWRIRRALLVPMSYTSCEDEANCWPLVSSELREISRYPCGGRAWCSPTMQLFLFLRYLVRCHNLKKSSKRVSKEGYRAFREFNTISDIRRWNQVFSFEEVVESGQKAVLMKLFVKTN